MNERIKALAVQAKEYARSHVADCRRFGHYMEYNEYELRFEQKFAELIVRECLELVSVNRDLAIEDGWNVDEAMSTAMYIVEEHFGVK